MFRWQSPRTAKVDSYVVDLDDRGSGEKSAILFAQKCKNLAGSGSGEERRHQRIVPEVVLAVNAPSFGTPGILWAGRRRADSSDEVRHLPGLVEEEPRPLAGRHGDRPRGAAPRRRDFDLRRVRLRGGHIPRDAVLGERVRGHSGGAALALVLPRVVHVIDDEEVPPPVDVQERVLIDAGRPAQLREIWEVFQPAAHCWSRDTGAARGECFCPLMRLPAQRKRESIYCHRRGSRHVGEPVGDGHRQRRPRAVERLRRVDAGAPAQQGKHLQGCERGRTVRNFPPA
eukprot:gene8716-biopygen762